MQASRFRPSPLEPDHDTEVATDRPERERHNQERPYFRHTKLSESSRRRRRPSHVPKDMPDVRGTPPGRPAAIDKIRIGCRSPQELKTPSDLGEADKLLLESCCGGPTRRIPLA